MNSSTRRGALVAAVLSVVSFVPVLRAQGTPIGFEETYALAADRQKALAQLLPGTEDYYFWHCIDAQHRGDFDAVAPLLKGWIERHGRTQRVLEIENRQALLTYDRDPAAAYQFLRDRLGLRFDDQRQSAGARPDLPTALAAQLLQRTALDRRAFELHPETVDGFKDDALAALAAAKLTDEQLTSLLRRIVRPDVPNLVALIVRGLRMRNHAAFGSLEIHKALLLDQYDELARQLPELLAADAFVREYATRLRPSPDVDWRHDEGARAAYFDRLWQFAERLPAAQNGFKVHVLYQRLQHDLAAGKLDKQRFLTYLRLPRAVGYLPTALRDSWQQRGEVAQFGGNYATDLPVVTDDQELVRACLQQFLQDEDSFESYRELLEESWLRRAFAEQKLLAGQGDAERLYSQLGDPEYYRQLEQRVEIAFARTQRTTFGRDEAVAIDVDVKNVPTLLVKVFALDAYAYQRDNGKDVDASIDLDGLVANRETTVTYGEPPLRRVRRHFDLSDLKEPGTYVVELLGNGTSSRAVIVKGSLHFTQRLGAAGHVLTIRAENGTAVPGAGAWFAGHEYTADPKGEVVLPFGAAGGELPIVLHDGAVSSLHRLGHLGENYALSAGVFVDREALVAGHAAKLLVRPQLRVAGQPIALSLLEQPELLITAVDLAGVRSTRTMRDLKLDGASEFATEIAVPADLVHLTVQLRGRVQNLAKGEPDTLTAVPAEFALNAIDATARTAAPLLGRGPDGWSIDVRGKNGEPKADRPLSVRLVLRDYADPLDVALKTDANGRAQLGALDGVDAVQLLGEDDGVGMWSLLDGDRALPGVVAGVAGTTLRVPYTGRATTATRAVLSLFELAGGRAARDRFENLAIQGGYVELRDLPAGDYQLALREAGATVRVQVTQGKVVDGWAMGRDRWLPAAGLTAPQIAALAVDGRDLRVQLAHASADARVHVFATRWTPAWSPLRLDVPAGPVDAAIAVPRAESDFRAGRELGDEYRYILDRRFQKKYPGNMLTRPGLLLNPWALAETSADAERGTTGGSRFGSRGGRVGGPGGGRGGKAGRPGGPGSGAFANVDFLPQAAAQRVNLKPDRDGVVRVPLADLGQGQQVHVVLVDGDETVWRSLTVPEQPLQPRGRQLQQGLDPAQHFTQQRRIEFVDGGGSAVIDDAATAKTETFATLADVFRLFTALSGNGELAEFAFVLRWPQLKPEEQRQLYAEHSCHELNFFLQQKDPQFFAAVVKPYLANKLDKTFLDHWLLGSDLSDYLQPWAFARLNLVEQILLLQRVPGERDNGARLLRERMELLPPDPARVASLFLSALQSGALGNGTGAASNERLMAAVDPAKPASEELAKALADRDGAAAAPDRAGLAAAAPAAPAEPTAGGVPEGRAAFRRNRMDDAKDKQQVAEPEQAGEEKNEKKADVASDEFFLGAKRKETEQLDQLRRQSQRELYRAPDKTRRYAENNWWHRRLEESGADMIAPNAFWRDFAANPDGTPFRSVHFAAVTGSLSEMLLALAVLDLPFAADAPKLERDGNRLTMRPATPMLLVRQELRPATAAAGAAEVLIGQNYYRLDDRYRMENGERLDRFVTGEFVVDVVYGCQVVLTNPTSTPKKLDILLQIPRGALPVQNGFVTRGQPVQLDPYATAKFEYAFYFPAAGDFAHFPAHVGKDGALVAAAPPAPMLHVVAVPTEIDAKSWERVSQDATADEVLAFLEQANLQQLDLSRLQWRLRDRAFFERCAQLLQKRHVWHQGVWSYALLHGLEAPARQWLLHQDGFVEQSGPALRSKLLTIDATARGRWQQIEFSPLFHARAHQRGKQREILDRDLAQQYQSLLAVLAHEPALDAREWLLATYYLLLQDRVDDALAAFAKVDRKAVPSQLQYDYLSCYLDFFTDDHARARAIAEPYRDHPVARWRDLFRLVLAQLDEAEGKAQPGDLKGRENRQDQLAATEPMLDLVVEGGRVLLRHKNLDGCEVRWFKMDVEFSFSTNPFVTQGSGSYAWVKPQRADRLPLRKDATETAIELPAEFRGQNVLVEVRGGGIVRRQTAFATTLAVQTVESYGQVLVTDAASKKPAPKVYVKVYARLPGGGVKFHKDGYTDLRGRFDYASVSEAGAAGAERFAILVLGEQSGAVIKEVAPPVQ